MSATHTASGSTPPQISLTLYFARLNAKAVILRRGPHKMARLILWDRATDTFEDGQWLRARVYEERCDLSADGAHFIYFALDGRWHGESSGSYSAISRPPYFTAVAFFPQGDCWGSGGWFVDEGRYVLNSGAEDRLCGSGLQQIHVRPNGPPYYVDANGKAVSFNRSDVVPSYPPERFVPGDERYETDEGRLYRVERGSRVLIRDMTDMEFETIRAPYDDRPESNADAAPWHPLEHED